MTLSLLLAGLVLALFSYLVGYLVGILVERGRWQRYFLEHGDGRGD